MAFHWKRLATRTTIVYVLFFIVLIGLLIVIHRPDFLKTLLANSQVFSTSHWISNSNRTITQSYAPGLEKIPEVFRERLKRVTGVCAKHPKLKGQIHGVYTHSSGVIYCFVPKAGCTFWKRIFHFVRLKNTTNYQTPWDIPRLYVHTNGRGNGDRFDPQEHSRVNYPTRFIVSRNPYSRILSGYLDKFYLPDFWLLYGTIFTKQTSEWSSKRGPDFMRRHFDHLTSLFPMNSSTGIPQESCGKHLTFAEFIKAILIKDYHDGHWQPVHEICNPCKFKPTHIVHLESFSQDTKTILRKMDLERFVEGFSHQEQVNEEIQTIVDYNFDRAFHQPSKFVHLYRRCTTPGELAYRLWQNFSWRGYIHPGLDYAMPDAGVKDVNWVKKHLLIQLRKARQKGLENPDVMKKAMIKFQKDLYSTLDKDLFQALTQKFQMDFEFFGYEHSKIYFGALYS